MSDNSFWNQRYDREDYLFGTEPAAFLRAHEALLTPGARTLAVADGEGRNSVYLAEKGLDVVALDNADLGIAKAQKLAGTRGVSVDFRLADIHSWDWASEPCDLLVAIFIQFASPDQRAALFEGFKTALRPGGRLLLHGYTPKQMDYGTGGPRIVENLYTEDLLAGAFSDFEIEELTAYDAHVDEGVGHSGLSALIDLVARKPA